MFRARRFVEKPAADLARQYLAAGNYVWNSGMFCFSARTILQAFERYAPAVLDAVKPVWSTIATRTQGPMLEVDAALFAAVPDISIDYAVMEKAAADGIVAVVRGNFDWSDVGSWQAVSDLTEPDHHGNRGRGERISIATTGTYVHAEDRVVATVGIENLVIIDTAGRGARRASRSPAAREGRGRRAQGTRPRRLQAPSHRRAALGRVHRAAGRAAVQDQAHRGEARRIAVAAAAPPAQRALGGGMRHGGGHARRRGVPARARTSPPTSPWKRGTVSPIPAPSRSS